MKNLLKEKPETKIGGRNMALLKIMEKNRDLNGDLLDIGCGYGWFEYQVGGKARKIIGIDFDPRNIETCQKNLKKGNVSFVVGNALKLPVGDNSMDTVVASEVIEHLPKGSEGKFFSEIYRVLKTDGNLYLTTPADYLLSKLFDPAWWLTGHRHYSGNKLSEMAQKEHLLPVYERVSGSWWSLLGLLNMYFSKWVLRRGKIFLEFFDKKETEEMENENGFMNVFAIYKKSY